MYGKPKPIFVLAGNSNSGIGDDVYVNLIKIHHGDVVFGFRSNPMLLPAIAFEIALQLAIVYSVPGHRIFATAPLSLNVWAVAASFALALFIAEEKRKSLFRSPSQRGN